MRIYRVERIRVLPKRPAFAGAIPAAEREPAGSSQLPPARKRDARRRDDMADYKSAYQLEGMIADAWAFMQAHPNGYGPVSSA